MTDLTRFRDHCRRMAKPGAHRPDCTTRDPKPARWAMTGDMSALQLVEVPRPATCAGCVPDADRVLFERLADEADAYLDRNVDQPLEHV